MNPPGDTLLLRNLPDRCDDHAGPLLATDSEEETPPSGQILFSE